MGDTDTTRRLRPPDTPSTTDTASIPVRPPKRAYLRHYQNYISWIVGYRAEDPPDQPDQSDQPNEGALSRAIEDLTQQNHIQGHTVALAKLIMNSTAPEWIPITFFVLIRTSYYSGGAGVAGAYVMAFVFMVLSGCLANTIMRGAVAALALMVA